MRESNNKEYKVKDIAETLGVSVKTIKNWEKKGYIPKARRNKWNWRVYSGEEKESITVIVRENNYFRSNPNRPFKKRELPNLPKFLR